MKHKNFRNVPLLDKYSFKTIKKGHFTSVAGLSCFTDKILKMHSSYLHLLKFNFLIVHLLHL